MSRLRDAPSRPPLAVTRGGVFSCSKGPREPPVVTEKAGGGGKGVPVYYPFFEDEQESSFIFPFLFFAFEGTIVSNLT